MGTSYFIAGEFVLARRHLEQGVILGSFPLAVLAEVHAHAGQFEAALEALREALALMDAMGGYYCHAELYRLKGKLLLQQAGSGLKSASPETSRSARHTAAIHRHPVSHTEAEACFRQALEIADRQHAKALELRATMSLSRLWKQQGKRNAARCLLAPIYGWFTEGFDTADLRQAKILLRRLGAPRRAFNSP